MPKQNVDRMLDEIRMIIGEYGDIPEREVYEALVAESEGWKMRLQELEAEDTDKDEE